MPNILLMTLLTILGANGGISGIVIDQAAIPLPLAEIQILDPATLKIEAQTLTDRTGAFRFENVKPGNHFVSFKMTGFKEHVVAVTVKSAQELNIGQQFLSVRPIIEELVTVDENGTSPGIERRKRDFARFDHIRRIDGTLIMNVCELMKNQPALSASRYSYIVVIIGTLVQTSQGSWLEQSCREPLKSGDFVWPTAVSLNEVDAKQAIRLMLPNDNLLTRITRPRDEEIDPQDRGRSWAAAYGRLDTRESLVSATCGDDGKLCGYGFGPISAPAQLIYKQGQIQVFDQSDR